jgi:hypothetical protein
MFCLAAAVALAGCSNSDKKTTEDPNIFPAKYKSQIVDFVPSVVSDATNIRSGFVSEPVLKTDGPVHVYYSCVRFNARTNGLQYGGSKDYAVYFYSGQINQFVEAPPDLCAKAAYQPFPEIEKICTSERKCH